MLCGCNRKTARYCARQLILAICRRNDMHGRPSATAMDLGLIRRGNALQACRQLGTLLEAQLLMPCLFDALNELSLQDR